MKRCLTFAILAAFGCQSNAQFVPIEFLAWYDGWGTLTVWGVGDVRERTVQCGDRQIGIRVVYDGHMRTAAPTASQTMAFAQASNEKLLRSFQAQGLACAFKLVK